MRTDHPMLAELCELIRIPSVSTGEPDHAALEQLAELADQGRLRVQVEQTFPLEQAAQAHRHGESLRPTLIIGAGKVGRLTAKRFASWLSEGSRSFGL
jgi:NADPH:quinone reductase-like Zn-dependent oxidoreductase